MDPVSSPWMNMNTANDPPPAPQGTERSFANMRNPYLKGAIKIKPYPKKRK